MIIGFTGSRSGLDPRQRATLRDILAHWKPTEAHHGDCIGGDVAFHSICLALEIPVVIHPPEASIYRAHCTGALRVEAPRNYLARDRDIVAAADHLIGCPKESRRPRSTRGNGTWYTMTHAEQHGVPLTVIWRDGYAGTSLDSIRPNH